MSDRLVVVVTVLVSFAVYALTLAPSLTWSHWGGDGGDFVTSAVTGRVPHPPGFPLYLLLSRIGVRIVGGDPAHTLNGLSALMAALAAGLTALACTRRTRSGWAGMTAGFSLAFAPLFWSQALITEVYSSAAFFVALALLLVERDHQDSPWAVRSAGLALGLAIAVHPVALFAVIYFFSRVPDRSLDLGCGMLIGSVFYAILPAVGSPWPQPWGDLGTLEGWWAYVSARLYRDYAFGLSLCYWPQRSLAWMVTLIRQITPLGGILVVLGADRLLKSQRAEMIGLSMTLGVVGLFSIGYNTDDSLVYLVPGLSLVVILLVEGIRSLERWKIPPWVGLIVPVLLLATNWQALDLSRDREAVDWIHHTLSALPHRAVAVTQDDRHTFGLWYATEVRAQRSDILVVDRRLWHQVSYRRYLASSLDVGVWNLHTPEDLALDRPLCEVGTSGVQCP
jgi:hypothetical protein